MSFLDAAASLERLGLITQALQCVYGNVDRRFRDGESHILNAELEQFDPTTAQINVLIAILTATANKITRLPSRRRFYNKVRSILKNRQQLVQGLLDGLK